MGKSFRDFIVPLWRTIGFALIFIAIVFIIYSVYSGVRPHLSDDSIFRVLDKLSPNELDKSGDELAKWFAKQFAGWTAIFYVLGISYIIEQTGFWKYLYALVFPPVPDFLGWVNTLDRESPWHDDQRLIGRHEGLSRFLTFASASKTPDGRRVGKIMFDGVYGRQGIGKTRLAVAWLRAMRGKNWHAGELKFPIPDDYVFRRPTAILVTYGRSSAAFWESIDTLRAHKNRHNVRILFESSMDFKLMVQAVSPAEFEFVKTRLWQVGDLDVTRLVGRSQTATPVANKARADKQNELEAPIIQTVQLASSFYRLQALNEAEKISLLGVSATAIGEREQAALEASKGRPLYVLRNRDVLNRKAVIDPYMVPNEDARRLINEAEATFPESGLKLVALAAMGGQFNIPAETRRTHISSSLDIFKIMTVFRDYTDDPAYLWLHDPRNYSPSISDPDVARLCLLEVLSRMHQPDIEVLARSLFKAQSKRDILKNFAAFMVDTAKLPEGRAAIVITYLTPVFADAPEKLKQLFDQSLKYLRAHKIGMEIPDESLLNALLGLSQMFRPASRAEFANYDHKYSVLNAFQRIFVGLISRVPDHAVRHRLMLDHAQLVQDAGLGPEIRLIANDDQWCASEHLDYLLGELFGVDDPRSIEDVAWIDFDALFDKPLGDSPAGEIEPNGSESNVLRAFAIMDKYFRDPKATHREMDEVDEQFLVDLLDNPSDEVSVLVATWAAYWFANPTYLGQETVWPQKLLASLKGLLSQKVDLTLRKRAMAALGQSNLMPIKDDVIMDWAVWADSGGMGTVPPVYALEPTISEDDLRYALTQALSVLKDLSHDRSLRRAAALFCLPYYPGNASVLEALADAVTDRQLNLEQRRTFLVRLIQAAGKEPDAVFSMLIRLLRKQDDEASYDAFLALSALDRLHDIKVSDLEVFNDSALLVETHRRFAQRHRAQREATAVITQSTPLSDRHIAGMGRNIHKLKAKDTTGRWAYYFVLVPDAHEEAFLKAIEGDGTIDLESFGSVIASNYGEEPSEEVRAYLKEKYGFDV